ncbi:DUF1634 domain-containing protein [Mucilaginibacter hurinus]|uniref:DUF1634 domain-containing protein n=1 Tax=Mucilaginibacter hurinus TaxID=2201324 RepID=A0A367GNS4_9SPHI|nr:DUF1634 domain-containing protein [Mucilaginibacter hurinus]RCH54343.1 DUF1634 domain-containing protein [Mucilaginibacter hurinus]
MARNQKTSLIISNLLRTGVFASIGIACAGGIIYLLGHGHEAVTYYTFKGTQAYEAPEYVFRNIFSLHGRAIIQAGILLLLATPIVRIIFSAISFAMERDYMYTGITLLVFAIITFSMLHGGTF